MTIANISILLLFSVICAVASYFLHIDSILEYRFGYEKTVGLRQNNKLKKITRCIQAAFFLAQLSISCLFGAAYIAWVAYV